MSQRLLCVSYRFPPETYPLAIRVRNMLEPLSTSWTIDAVTAADNPWSNANINMHQVAPWKPERLFQGIRRLNLGLFLDLLIWPDPFVFWVLPALLQARRLLKAHSYQALVVFMMPYSQGIVGVLLKEWYDIPLILNLNDSPTCSDMRATFPSALHYRLARWLEDWYIRHADAIIYVSKRNMDRVRERQPPSHHHKFHLIRRGAAVPKRPSHDHASTFRIVYTGGMGGWYWFTSRSSKSSFLRSIKRKIEHGLRYRVTKLDGRSHSPVYIGQAIKQVIKRHPEWAGRIQFDVIGNRVPQRIVDQVLDKFDLHDVVNVSKPVPHEEAVQCAAQASLLFMALPNRVDGSPGGRISAKTYEYLMTNRPILGALPPGENREYLGGRPGVYLTDPRDVDAMADVVEQLAGIYLTDPRDVDAMADVVEQLAGTYFSGDALQVERLATWSEISIPTQAKAFEALLNKVIA